jgi:hypothetical protein
MRKINKKYLILCAVLVVFGLIAGCNKTEQLPMVSADQLYEKYERDEYKADVEYRDKVVVVYGKIQSIGKNYEEGCYMRIVTQFIGSGVKFTFPFDKQSSFVGHLFIGDSVKVKGVVKGFDGDRRVLVSGCELLQ